jgi:nucleoside-diphosphate-sugar epimerase
MADAPRLLVFGSTGYTGQGLVTVARKRGLETHAHVRPNSPSAERLLPRYRAMDVQIHEVAWTPATIAELVRSVEPTHVFCLLGTTRKKAAANPNSDYAAVDVGMTLMVVDAVEAMERPARLVYLSATGVREGVRGAYAKARWQVERELRSRMRDWVIARPSFISGDDREESRPAERIATRLGDAMLNGLGRVGLGEIRDRFGSLTGRELGAGLLYHALEFGPDTRTVDAADLRGHLDG